MGWPLPMLGKGWNSHWVKVGPTLARVCSRFGLTSASVGQRWNSHRVNVGQSLHRPGHTLGQGRPTIVLILVSIGLPSAKAETPLVKVGPPTLFEVVLPLSEVGLALVKAELLLADVGLL